MSREVVSDEDGGGASWCLCREWWCQKSKVAWGCQKNIGSESLLWEREGAENGAVIWGTHGPCLAQTVCAKAPLSSIHNVT